MFWLIEEELGADEHVGMNNITYTAGMIFDWFLCVFLDQPGEPYPLDRLVQLIRRRVPVMRNDN